MSKWTRKKGPFSIFLGFLNFSARRLNVFENLLAKIAGWTAECVLDVYYHGFSSALDDPRRRPFCLINPRCCELRRRSVVRSMPKKPAA